MPVLLDRASCIIYHALCIARVVVVSGPLIIHTYQLARKPRARFLPAFMNTPNIGVDGGGARRDDDEDDDN